jgi:hypothetical protein
VSNGRFERAVGWLRRSPIARPDGVGRFRRLSVIAGTEFDVSQCAIRLDRVHFVTEACCRKSPIWIRPVDRRAGHTYWRVFASWLRFAEARLCSWSDYCGNGQTACIQIAAAAAPASSVPMARWPR